MNTKAVLAELNRELAIRQDLYPMWVSYGRLTSKAAEHRIAALQKAIELIEESQRPQAQQFSLFGVNNHPHA
jgi:hypothetical protein